MGSKVLVLDWNKFGNSEKVAEIIGNTAMLQPVSVPSIYNPSLYSTDIEHLTKMSTLYEEHEQKQQQQQQLTLDNEQGSSSFLFDVDGLISLVNDDTSIHSRLFLDYIIPELENDDVIPNSNSPQNKHSPPSSANSFLLESLELEETTVARNHKIATQN